jgi:phage head maturation protease
MSQSVTLRGYALPWNESVLLSSGTYERFAPRAFDHLLHRVSPVSIRWRSHDANAPMLARTSDRSARLFADDYGLGFEARIDMREHWDKLRAITQRNGPFDRCSIGGLAVIASDRDRYLKSPRETITHAHINHIAIVDYSAAYKATAVWPAERDLEHAPWRIQQMAARWSAGRAQWQRYATARANLVSAAERIVKGKGDGVNGDLSAAQLAKVLAIGREVELTSRARTHGHTRKPSLQF